MGHKQRVAVRCYNMTGRARMSPIDAHLTDHGECLRVTVVFNSTSFMLYCRLSVLSGYSPTTEVPFVLHGWATVVFLISALMSPCCHDVVPYQNM